MHEERPTATRIEDDYHGLGASLTELRALSGVGQG